MPQTRNLSLITEIIFHCSATKETQDYPYQKLLKHHLSRGFSDVGYHFYVTKDGVVHECRPLGQVGAHTRGYNKNSIGICYEGGLCENGKPKDTRTTLQTFSIEKLLTTLFEIFPITKISGHNEYSNKACPCFDVIEYKDSLSHYQATTYIYKRSQRPT